MSYKSEVTSESAVEIKENKIFCGRDAENKEIKRNIVLLEL